MSEESSNNSQKQSKSLKTSKKRKLPDVSRSIVEEVSEELSRNKLKTRPNAASQMMTHTSGGYAARKKRKEEGRYLTSGEKEALEYYKMMKSGRDERGDVTGLKNDTKNAATS